MQTKRANTRERPVAPRVTDRRGEAPDGWRGGCLWRLRATASWAAHELGEPALCFACVYAGVLSITLLPGGLLALLYGPGLLISPLAALPLALRVFDRRAYARWRAGRRGALLARMLRACSDGVNLGMRHEA
jgi:hypothetical protein